MKKIIFLLFPVIFISHNLLYAQRNCGFELNRANLIAKDPSWADKLEARRTSLQSAADHYKQLAKSGAAEKTTAASAIPVIFHFCVTSSQLAQIGGVAGIAQRCDSQIAVLNRDYNRQNADSVKIPTGWKHLYASSGIRFGLAHTTPSGFGSPGYEIRIIPDAPGGFSTYGDNYKSAKYSDLGGLDAWDVTEYLNIWCINFTDYVGLLGLTTFKSETGGAGFPVNEEGVCINYAAVGKRVFSSDYYISAGGGDYYDMGRTLTHELGHFFEIWHTWGDDFGQCPWNGGSDDGLADTPPEGDSKFGNLPDTIPGGTYYDQCQYDGVADTQLTLYGIASHDYMNYVDDIAMFMFTTDQAAAMASQVAPGGENYSLTQHPELLVWSPKTAVAQVYGEKSLSIFPNPSTGVVNILFDNNADMLKQIEIFNVLGEAVQNIVTAAQKKDYYSIDLSGMSKGIYFIRCNFVSGSVTRKILLQ